MRCFGDVFEKTSTSMFLTMFFKTQNIRQTMHLTMLIAHPYAGPTGRRLLIVHKRQVYQNYQLKLWETESAISSGTTVWKFDLQYTLTQLVINQPWVPPFGLGLHDTSTLIEEFQNFRLKMFSKRLWCHLWEVEFAKIKFHYTKYVGVFSSITINSYIEDLDQWVLS